MKMYNISLSEDDLKELEKRITACITLYGQVTSLLDDFSLNMLLAFRIISKSCSETGFEIKI